MMSQKRDKWGTCMFWVELTFEWYEHCLNIFIVFSSERMLRENNCMRATSITVTLFFFESVILKVQISFSKIMRHPHNGIWKTLNSWRFYGHGSTKWTRIFEEHCTKAFNLFLHASFSHTSLVFKFNLVFIE